MTARCGQCVGVPRIRVARYTDAGIVGEDALEPPPRRRRPIGHAHLPRVQ